MRREKQNGQRLRRLREKLSLSAIYDDATMMFSRYEMAYNVVCRTCAMHCLLVVRVRFIFTDTRDTRDTHGQSRAHTHTYLLAISAENEIFTIGIVHRWTQIFVHQNAIVHTNMGEERKKSNDDKMCRISTADR